METVVLIHTEGAVTSTYLYYLKKDVIIFTSFIHDITQEVLSVVLGKKGALEQTISDGVLRARHSSFAFIIDTALAEFIVSQVNAMAFFISSFQARPVGLYYQ